MPSFFRQQQEGEQQQQRQKSSSTFVSGAKNDLQVVTDITLVCSNGVMLNVDDIVAIMEECGEQVTSIIRRNGLTVEVTGPWEDIFHGLAECHSYAHLMGSTDGVHTTMSMSSTTTSVSGSPTKSTAQLLPQRRPSRRSSRSKSSGIGSSPGGEGTTTTTLTPLSPEMRGMHSQLQQEEEMLKRERDTHRTLQEQLARTKSQTRSMMEKNHDLKEEMTSISDGYEVEKRRQVLRSRKQSSPRNSFSDGTSNVEGEGETKTRRSSFDNTSESDRHSSSVASSVDRSDRTSHESSFALSLAPSGRTMNSDQHQSNFVSPVKEVSSEEEDDEEESNSVGRSSMISNNEEEDGGYDNEVAMKEELEEDMRRLLQRGVMLFSENKANQAKPLFEEVVRIAHDLGNVAVEGRAVGNLASVFEATGQHHRAIELYMQCISILRQVGDSRKEARILYNVSHSYLSLERYDEAIDYLNQSLALTDDEQTRLAVEQQLTVVRHSMVQQMEDDGDDDRLFDF